MRTKLLQTFALSVAFGMVGCSGSDVLVPPAVGGATGVGGGSSADAGGTAAGGDTGASIGGIAATGGSSSGNNATGGAATGGARTGGAPGNGGTPATGGMPGTGGARTGGAPGIGGAATGGAGVGGAATGGNKATGGAATGGAGVGGAATGGNKATGGAATGGATGVAGGTSTVNCSATMPTGGTQHTGNTQGGSNNLAWNLWMNGSGGSLTTFSTPAFSAAWGPSSGDYLARLGLEWGSNSKAYTTYGTITAQFAYTRTGTGGGYSYIGIYGWSTNPCIEYYIVDDSYNTMPVNPGSTTLKGTATIDGGTYNLYTRSTTGTGGNRCGNVTSWNQFYSVRKTARQCGTISITQHFDAWAAAGMALGNMLEAKILVEVGGGTGTVNFPVANVTAQ